MSVTRRTGDLCRRIRSCGGVKDTGRTRPLPPRTRTQKDQHRPMTMPNRELMHTGNPKPTPPRVQMKVERSMAGLPGIGGFQSNVQEKCRSGARGGTGSGPQAIRDTIANGRTWTVIIPIFTDQKRDGHSQLTKIEFQATERRNGAQPTIWRQLTPTLEYRNKGIHRARRIHRYQAENHGSGVSGETGSCRQAIIDTIASARTTLV